MDKILDEILFSDSNFIETQRRLIGIINKALKANRIQPYPQFHESTTEDACDARIRKHKKMDKKFKKTIQKENDGEDNNHIPMPVKKRASPSSGGLVLPNRKKQTDSFLNSLAKKYSKNAAVNLNEDPLSDEQFVSIQKRFQHRNKRSKK